MKDIYEMFNDINEKEIWPNDLKREYLTEHEKKRIYKHILAADKKTYTKKTSWRKIAVAALVVVLLAGVGIPVTAKVYSYINGNTKNNYKETLNVVIENSETKVSETEKSYMDETLQETESKDAISEEQVVIEVADVSRSENTYTFTVVFDFKGDITKMNEKTEKWLTEGRSRVYAPVFSNSCIYIDDVNMLYAEWDVENNRWKDWFAWVVSEVAYFDDSKFVIEIDVYLRDELDKKHEITFVYKDLEMEDHVIEGEWTFNYTLDPSAYEEEQLTTMDTYLHGEADNGMEMTITEYAVTPNGLKMFGDYLEPSVYTFKETNENSNLRIIIQDDLGNYYLMYQKRYGEISESELELKYPMMLELYTGVNAQFAEEREYLLQWHPDATKLTIAIEQEKHIWNENGEFDHSEFTIVSDSLEIPIK